MGKNAVVIVNYNDSDRIINLIEILESYDILDKIVISDNNSDEKEKEKLKKIAYENVEIVFNKNNLGFSGANNSALRRLKEYSIEYVFTINSDVVVSKDVMLKSIDFLNKNEEIAVVSTNMKEYGEIKQCYYNFPTIRHCIAENLGLIKIFGIKPKKNEIFKEYFTCDYIRSSYWCVRYKDFEEIDFFDENTFLYHVETCVGIKLNRINKKCAILENEEYNHNHIYKKGYKLNGYKDAYKSVHYIFKAYYNKNAVELFFLKLSYRLGLILRIILGIK